jgi:hypothetical protein
MDTVMEEKLFPTCSHCDTVHTYFDTTKYQSGNVCSTCNENRIECDDCGEDFLQEELVVVYGTKKVCDDCLKTNYTYCGECDEYDDADDSNWVESSSKYVCNSCMENWYVWCEDCESLTHTDYSNEVNNGRKIVCSDCMDSYSECYHCLSVYHNDDMYGRCDRDVCDSCSDNYYDYCDECDEYFDNTEGCDNCGTNIHSYGYKPDPEFRGQNKNNLWIGMELEVDFPNQQRSDLNDISEKICSLSNNLIYNKWDGSVHEGFEMVTHPIDPYKWDEFYAWDALSYVRGQGGISWNSSSSCLGMHLHLSRSAFTATHLYKYVKFFSLNVEALQHFAGRSVSYANFDFDEAEFRYMLNPNKNRRSHVTSYRNRAINLSNSTTIELRLFKGSLNPQTVRANVQFALSLYEYTKSLSVRAINNGALGWNEFYAYVEQNQDLYASLFNCKRFAKREEI